MKAKVKISTDPAQRTERPKGLRMKELAAITGIPKSAILHYLALGCLPEPVKTSPNMAYYDPVCIERIEFIKAIQEKYALPLSKIKTLLSHRDKGTDVTPLVELSATVFGDAESKPLNEDQLCQATGLRPRKVRELIECGLLIPLNPGQFTQQDVSICQVYNRCFSMGANISDLAFYTETAKTIVDMEMRLRHKLTAQMSEAQDAEVTRKMISGARAVRSYVIDRTFQQRVALAENLKDTNLLTGKKGESTGKK